MLNALATAFVEMDAEVLARQTEWALGRAAALKEFKASEEYETLRRNAWKLYPRLFSIAGGKGWYNVLNGSSEAAIRSFVVENCKAIADKRNATIVSKLKKNDITSIGALEFARTDDGFDGYFSFDTATVRIRTIIAGGYNIQCLHYRTLVFVNGKTVRS